MANTAVAARTGIAVTAVVVMAATLIALARVLWIGDLATAANWAQLVSIPLAMIPLGIGVVMWARNAPAAVSGPPAQRPPLLAPWGVWVLLGLAFTGAALVWIAQTAGASPSTPSATGPTQAPPPGAAPSTPPPAAPALAFTTLPASIKAGQDVHIEGDASGLGGDTLWIVTKPDMGGGKYFLTVQGPVIDHDGHWMLDDEEVGDSTDRRHNIVYRGIKADGQCSAALNEVPEDEDGSYTFATLPSGCTLFAAEGVVTVR